MADIPRFNAQLAQISVPSMHNFQQEQNEQIYRAVAQLADTSANIAGNLYKEEQKQKASVQGAEDVEKAKEDGKEFDLASLPTATTAAQKAYNDSAINAFAAQYTVDTSLALTNLENENRDNPFEFLQKAQAYIDGASSNIPANLRASIVKPIEMNARSIYSSLLKKKIDDNRKASQATTLISLDEMERDALNTADPTVQDEKIGQFVTIATNAAVAGDITPEYARKKIESIRKGIASQRLTNQLLASGADLKKMTSIINMAMLGKTDSKFFDSLSPEERAEATKTALGNISYARGYPGQIAEQAGKYFINEAQLNMYNNASKNDALTDEDLKDISWGNKSLFNAMKADYSGETKISVPAVVDDIIKGIDNGSIDEKDIIDAFDSGYITGKDALYNLNSLYSPLSLNKKKNGYDVFRRNLDTQLKDITNSIGVVSKTNVKKKYIDENMNAFLSGKDRTDDEILSFGNALEEQANKKFSKENEYEPVYTPQWFQEKTGYSISVIESAVMEASVGGQLDMKKLRQLLLDMTGNDRNAASSLYSLYLAVKNQ